jgi:hypothetical protein
MPMTLMGRNEPQADQHDQIRETVKSFLYTQQQSFCH